ncbi:hypothetical protein ZIOFF_024283 [Zingiber officinale]|uniref:Uncharacterized protein n=1 Tax=Zingiber officinale TaxID=94328 RepID=A0A8J5LDG0_ZINOF|nr:hypothetical protein ZIOFF_024283 [Zingiber officinale]
MGFNVELASLASKVRGDVCLCCCVISGGVYENLLFFPVIQLIKDRYPGVQINVVASPRGKQVYEVNKNVRWANVYDLDEDFPEPADRNLTGFKLQTQNVRRNVCLFSLPSEGDGDNAGSVLCDVEKGQLGHVEVRAGRVAPAAVVAGESGVRRVEVGGRDDDGARKAPSRVVVALKLVASAATEPIVEQHRAQRHRVGSVSPDVEVPVPAHTSCKQFHQYDKMEEWLGRPFRSVPRHLVSPLRVSISKKLRAYVEEKYSKVGVRKGGFVVIHGIETDSVASMRSKGDSDSLYILLACGNRGVKPLFVIPHEKVREDVEEDPLHYHSWPALVDDAIGASFEVYVHIALFSSEEKANTFVPNAREKRCSIIASSIGKLIDIDVNSVKNAVGIFEGSKVLINF